MTARSYPIATSTIALDTTADAISAWPRDDNTLVLTVGAIGYGHQRRSIVLAPAQVAEVRDYLDGWLADRSHAVPAGPSTADVVTHYREVAMREKLAADRARREAEAAGAVIAHRIRAELVCCDTFDGTGTWPDGHALCYWGEAAARLAEEAA